MILALAGAPIPCAAPAFRPCINSCAEACRVMSRRCPFCHIVHGRICVSLQHPDLQTSLAPARRSMRRPVVVHVRPWPGSWPGLRIGPRETTVAANKAARICLSRKEAIDLALLLITAAQKVIADTTFIHGDLLQLCDILITILSSYLWEHFRVSLKIFRPTTYSRGQLV